MQQSNKSWAYRLFCVASCIAGLGVGGLLCSLYFESEGMPEQVLKWALRMGAASALNPLERAAVYLALYKVQLLLIGGIGMAVGYANGHKVPYQRAVSKYTPTWPRSFMPANPNLRSLVAKMKLIPNKEVLNGKRVLFCDDSIVRGNQLKDKTVALRELGAKEIHMRVACPPLVYGCPFINFAASKTELELITRQIIQDIEGDMNKNVEAYTQTDSPEYQRMVSEIAKRLSLESLMFSKLETLVQAIGLPKCQLCTHCFDGSSAHTIKGQLE